MILAATPEPASLSLIIAIVTTFGVIFVILSKYFDYFVAERRRRRGEEKSEKDGSADPRKDCAGCKECQERVKALLDIIRGDLKTVQESRIADLKEWATMARDDAHLARTAVREFTKVVRENMGIEFDETGEATEEEEQDED